MDKRLQKIVTDLLDQKYYFEEFNTEHIINARDVRFFTRIDKIPVLKFNNDRKCRKIINIKSMEITIETIISTAVFNPRKALSKKETIDCINFCLKYAHLKLKSITIWAGWTKYIFILMRMKDSYEYVDLPEAEFRKKESKIENINEYLPDFMIVVSGIILEYAEYSLYNFLAEEYEKKLSLPQK